MEQRARDQNEGVRHPPVQGYNLLVSSTRVLPHTSLGIVEGKLCLGGFCFRALVKVLLWALRIWKVFGEGFGWWLWFGWV